MPPILGVGQHLKEPVCEEKAKAVLGKIVAGELAQEVLKKVYKYFGIEWQEPLGHRSCQVGY